MLDRAELCKRFDAGEKFEFQFFWGHQRDASEKVTASCLSQWYVAPYTVDGIPYQTAEHWMDGRTALGCSLYRRCTLAAGRRFDD